MTPFDLGREDAQNGWPFCPEAYFVCQSQAGEYAAGFLNEQPENQAALAYLDELRQADLAVDAAQYTPRPGIDF